MESRHLPNLSVQNALDCISENFNLKNFPGGACPRNSLEKCAAVLMGLSLVLSQSYHILPLYTIPLGLLYQKILRPPLSIIGTELSGFFREEISFICAGIL